MLCDLLRLLNIKASQLSGRLKLKNREKMKKLICKKCGHKETIENINLSINTKILIAQIPRVREKDGLHIYPLYCLT